jgi:hypothetical protein
MATIPTTTEPGVGELIRAALKELQGMFPAHEYIRIQIGCSWFGDETVDMLTRIVVTKYEWNAPTLSEAMSQIRTWKQENTK